MSFLSWALWGFVATLLLTTISSVAQGLRLTRMNIPFMLGTMFTSDRDRAKIYGFAVHLFNGWIFSFFYIAIFESLHYSSWWLGGILGLLHALFILTWGMRALPGLHPRMASEQHGPTVARQLEPPGFLALNYGVRTPVATFVSHLLFGIVLGSFYRVLF